jgi:hypothetical protein
VITESRRLIYNLNVCVKNIPLQLKLTILISMDLMLICGVLEPIQTLRASHLLSNENRDHKLGKGPQGSLAARF